MTQVTVSLHQALQLVGLLPSLFVIILLLFLCHDYRRVIAPIGYFLTLSASFAEPLMPLLGLEARATQAGLTWLQTAYPAFCFLLIVQFIRSRLPSILEWLILLLPIMLGTLISYTELAHASFCIGEDICIPSDSAGLIYHIFSTSFVFLLLLFYVQTRSTEEVVGRGHRRHKYWLVIAMIFLNLFLLMNRLAVLMDYISTSEGDLVNVILRSGFIYLVLTSVFRVFDDSMPFGVNIQRRKAPQIDDALIQKIEAAMQNKQMYREMGISRESLAKHVEVGEQALSRALNGHFKQSFNEYVNSYRIKEAKERLEKETTAVTVIAFEVGFNSIASFNRVFRSFVGTSPTEYRAKHSQA